jgi:hypothetical protein
MSEVRQAPGGGGTVLRFAWQQLTKRGAALPALPSFASLAPALRLLPGETVSRVVELDLLATDQGWRSSGVTVRRGQGFTLFADGAVWIAKALGVGAGPGTALWVRIGGRAPIRKMAANATSFEAWDEGELEFCLKPPGEWLDDSGRFDPDVPRTGATGKIAVTLALWPGDAAAGVAAFERVTGLKGLVTQAEAPPGGWSYLWRIGDGSIYRPHEEDGKACIHVHTHGDVGILQYPIEGALDDDTVLEWRWRVDRLPSSLPEHIQPTHDYLSIAVEYDNGQDLTYFWSASLAQDTVFKCPLPWWSSRETHWVVRSGTAGLGTWMSETRQLKADYATAIGGAMPTKIVRVWLIANSVFQRGHGEARFADIALVSGGTRRQIV